MPTPLCQQVFLAQQVRQYESVAAQQSGVSLYTLMQRAGQAVFDYVLKAYPSAQQYVILVGSGNNAGDGYIVASLAKQAGKQVTVIAATDKLLTGDALKAQQAWQALGGDITRSSYAKLDNAELIIDGLLGTGIQSQVRAPFSTLIEAANSHACPIVAIDLPSGISADTGTVQGIAINADATVTFVGIKQGLVTGAGKQQTGKLIFNALGMTKAFRQLATASGSLINYQPSSPLTKRAANSHKGSHGKLLCIGGNVGTAGAIRLTGEAALRCGAGMVKVYTHPESVLSVSIGRPELMVTASNLEAALEWATCVVIGPGLGQDDWAKGTFNNVMTYCLAHKLPLIVDADALNILATNASAYRLKECIITPHAGEAARLLSASVIDIENDRFHYARQLAKRYTATCVLKGAGSIIDNSEGCWICSDGNPALAVGGSGDVLSGIIAALIAQGLTTQQAACYGVVLHAKAGDIAAARDGQRGMLPSDLFAIVRELVN